MFYKIKKDIEYIMENDPAARTKLEVFLLYPSIHARIAHIFSHFLYKNNLFFLARLISQLARFFYRNRDTSRCNSWRWDIN